MTDRAELEKPITRVLDLVDDDFDAHPESALARAALVAARARLQFAPGALSLLEVLALERAHEQLRAEFAFTIAEAIAHPLAVAAAFDGGATKRKILLAGAMAASRAEEATHA